MGSIEIGHSLWGGVSPYDPELTPTQIHRPHVGRAASQQNPDVNGHRI